MARTFAVTLTLLLAAGMARADELLPPTRAALTRAVRQYVDRGSDAEACRPPVTVHGELRYECVRTECPGSCQVVHVITVLGYRAGTFRRVSRREESRGDTGECGCCLEEF